MSELTKFIDITYNKVYAPMLRYINNTGDCTFLLYGGWGSGKSHLAAVIFLMRLLGSKEIYGYDSNDVALRKNFTDIKESQFKFIQKIAQMYKLDKYIKYRDSNPRCLYNTENKSRIYAAGTADVENLKSKCDPTGYWFEEMTQSNYEDFLNINSQFRVNTPVPILKLGTFNPISKTNWIKTKIFDESKIELKLGEFKDWQVKVEIDDVVLSQNFGALKVNWKHNQKHLKPSTIAEYELLKKRDPRAYKVAVEGEWGELESGFYFKMDFLRKWNALPDDAFGYIYCDPSLAKKRKGDTVAIVNLWVSPTTQNYYVKSYRCFECTEANDLIAALFDLRDEKTMYIGMDGHFGQGNHWDTHLTNYCLPRGIMKPIINWCQYSVNAYANNTQVLYNEGRILFPPDIEDTDEGKRFLSQLITFTGQKEKGKDDAPDALICSVQLSFEKGMRMYNFAG